MIFLYHGLKFQCGRMFIYWKMKPFYNSVIIVAGYSTTLKVKKWG